MAPNTSNKASQTPPDASITLNITSQDSVKACKDSFEASQTPPDASSSTIPPTSTKTFSSSSTSFIAMTSKPTKRNHSPIYPVWARFCFRKPNVGMRDAQLTKELLCREYTGKPFLLIEQHVPQNIRERFGEDVCNIHDLVHEEKKANDMPADDDDEFDELSWKPKGPSPREMSETVIRLMKKEAQFMAMRLYEAVLIRE